jgi:hypothetical protein
VLLLNCGATEDVRSLCNLPSNVRIVIIDHHRPVWHGHNNDDDMDTLVLVDEDDPVPKAAVPTYDQQLDNEGLFAGAALRHWMFMTGNNLRPDWQPMFWFPACVLAESPASGPCGGQICVRLIDFYPTPCRCSC